MELQEAKRVFGRFHLAEALNPTSWHWITDAKSGWFVHEHHPENAEERHISEVREKLSAKNKELLDEALRSLAKAWKGSGNPDAQKAVATIGMLLSEKESSRVWSVPDLSIELYTEKSSQNLVFPKMVDFALANGGVLQSAREAVIYRMHKGKDDFSYWYLTRTAAIYYRKNGSLLVAFDDDPFDNILLSATDEGRAAGRNWVVDVSRVSKAIERAEKTGRTISVTAESGRSDAMDVARCMIGDKSRLYEHFLQKHGYERLYAWVVKSGDCGRVSENEALIRCVGVLDDGDVGSADIDADGDYGRSARGVQKISIGNRGHSVAYIGLLLFKQLGTDNPRATKAYFEQVEDSLSPKEQGVFYAGLGACREFIKTKEDLDTIVQVLLGIVPNAPEDTTHLFSGLSLHRSLVHSLEELRLLLLFYLRVVQRSPKQAPMIYDNLKTLVDAGLVRNTSDLAAVDAYLQEFQFLSADRYRQYLSLDPSLRREFLRNHKKKYLAIALGEQQKISIEDADLIWYAVNSKNLTKDIIHRTLERYGEEANKLSQTSFEPFDVKDLNEISGYKLANPLRPALGKMLADVSVVLLTENYPYEKIMPLLGQRATEINHCILLLTLQENKPVSDDVVRLVYGEAYEAFKGKNYLHDIAWMLAVKHTVDSSFGEDQRREFAQASTLRSFNYQNPTKTETETLLTVYNRFIELYNDTIKHDFDDKAFLERIHKPKSQILAIGKDLKKIVPIKNKTKVHIRCIPSKAPLDLFYGYYGENCTSEYPQELFDEPFTPVRIIQMMNGEPTIEGCIHLYTTEHQGKRILAVLGVEPRGDFTNRSDPGKLFTALNNAIEKLAKKHDYEYVCYPQNATMHSNRGQIGQKIAEHIRNKESLPLDFHFPKDHSSYTTQKLLITWKR
ncbi:hypothetical protein GOV07_04520 [Candidatus Woesearchaeota archaeon]|nr:hypothetical protein [Candidatus Woesearchaeota archaeon]